MEDKKLLSADVERFVNFIVRNKNKADLHSFVALSKNGWFMFAADSDGMVKVTTEYNNEETRTTKRVTKRQAISIALRNDIYEIQM
jgi:uncharacterized membrane protein YjjP (DUF1212 family)